MAVAEYHFTSEQLSDYLDKVRAAWEASRAMTDPVMQKVSREMMLDAAAEIERLRAIILRAIELPHPSEMEEPGGLWHDMRAVVQQSTKD